MLHRTALIATTIALLPLSADAQRGVSPPQGYIGFTRDFGNVDPVYWDGTQRGFYNLDYDFQLRQSGSELAGTFWANSFSFRDSSSHLPANHVNRGPNGAQGGYLGVQVKSATESIAIFSIWWATDARPGPGAHCVDSIEMWYHDDAPFEPPITSVSSADRSRPVAGGPFRSCRIPIELKAGTNYRLRLHEIGDARRPNDPEWWAAYFVNQDTGHVQMIGELQVPGSWGWLNTSSGGFIEHFTAMPAGCDSIPASSSTFAPARADNGTWTSRVNARVYGACEPSISRRTAIGCGPEGCIVNVAPPGKRPTPPPRSAQEAPRLPPSPAPTPTPKPASSSLEADLLREHNRVRASVGVGPMQWSGGVAAYAQRWADHLASEGCRLEHRKNGKYGENLAMWTGTSPPGEAARMWETERPLYDGGVFNNENFEAGHYTQMVWRNSTRLGCGLATCGRATVVVCNYDPAGNYMGQKPY